MVVLDDGVVFKAYHCFAASVIIPTEVHYSKDLMQCPLNDTI